MSSRNESNATGNGNQGVKKIGFAAMTTERQRQIASEGGKVAHKKGKAHTFTSETARSAAIKGVQMRAARQAAPTSAGASQGQ